jgi:hypothetical protein
MESLISLALRWVPLTQLERPEMSTILQDAFSRVPVNFYKWCQDDDYNHVYMLCQSGDETLDWNTGLVIALHHGHYSIVRLLLDRGANNHNTVLCNAIQHKNLEMIMYLITEWSDMCNWDLAIRVAVAPTCMSTIHLLIDCNVCDWDTLMFVGARVGNLDVIDTAIHHGALVIQPAIDVARLYNHDAIATYIEESHGLVSRRNYSHRKR